MGRHVSRLLAATLLTLVGCGRPDRGPDPGALDASGGGDARAADAGAGGPVEEADHPATLARAWCANAFACDCDTTHADEAACVRAYEESLERLGATFRDMGLVYDATCPAGIVREIDTVGCRGYRPVELGCTQCALYHGDLAQGEACTDVGVCATPCARGLRCLPAMPGAPSTCEDPCRVLRRFVGAGEACDPEGTSTCDPLGAFCNAGTCEAFPAAGETCDRGMCERSAYCDRAADTCAPARPRGETCTSGVECETRNCAGSVCASFCGPRPF